MSDEEFKDSAFWDFIDHLNIDLPEDDTIAAAPAPVPREQGFQNGSSAVVDERLCLRVRELLDKLLSESPGQWDQHLAGHHKTVRDEILDYVWAEIVAGRFGDGPLDGRELGRLFLVAGWIILGQLIKDGDVNDDHADA